MSHTYYSAKTVCVRVSSSGRKVCGSPDAVSMRLPTALSFVSQLVQHKEVTIKILSIDIETAPNIVYTWGMFNQNIAPNQVVKTGYTMCFAAKWLHKKNMIFEAVWKDKERMVNRAYELLNEADAVVHYNG